MTNQTKNRSGFTIIEVVITIAIGAAVMALVLNAVAGARRSQRNNARSSDVNQIAAGVNQYIAVRNALPNCWNDISSIVEDGEKFGHYSQTQTGTDCNTADTGTASINATGAWTTTTAPLLNGDFLAVGTVVAASSTTSAQVILASTATGVLKTAAGQADHIVIFQKAKCGAADSVVAGGIREMAIFYRLEGHDDTSCLEI